MSKHTRFDREKAAAREELYRLRERVLRGDPDQPHEIPTSSQVLNWMQTLPPHPESTRERFLQICAIGGAIPFEAMLRGITARPANPANVWELTVPSEKLGWIFLWVGSRDPAKCELFDGWRTARSDSLARAGRNPALFVGTSDKCIAHARVLFQSWDAAERLGATDVG